MVGAVTTAVSKSTGGFTIVCVEDNPQHQTRRGGKKGNKEAYRDP